MLSASTFEIAFILAHLTKFMTIREGDVLLTGSPFFNPMSLEEGDLICGSLKFDQEEVRVESTLYCDRVASNEDTRKATLVGDTILASKIVSPSGSLPEINNSSEEIIKSLPGLMEEVAEIVYSHSKVS